MSIEVRDRHRKTIAVFKGLRDAAGENAYEYDFLDSGGEGDLGELLMDLLDIYHYGQDVPKIGNDQFSGNPVKAMS